MKLYKEFTKAISELNTLKLVLATTFNLSNHFIEKYFLSAITRKSYNEIRTIYDIESAVLELRDQECDFVVFHDYRAVSKTHSKRIATPFIPIDPSRFGNQFSKGVFHPKVTLLIDVDYKAKIVVGSANLSVGGYGKNVESVSIKTLENKKIVEEVFQFFTELLLDTNDCLEYNNLEEVKNKVLANCTNTVDDDLQFVSSISGAEDQRKLFDVFNTNAEEVHVWSPYFSDNITSLYNDHFKSFETKLNLIPDYSLGKVRIAESIKKEIDKIDNLSFGKDLGLKLRKFDSPSLQHAKVWLNTGQVAIGSWNFTSSALNVGDNGVNNIEAGIIQAIKPQERKSLIKNIENFIPAYSSSEDLKLDKAMILNSYSSIITLSLDWDTFRISFYDKAEFENYNIDELLVKLPDTDKKIKLYKLRLGYLVKDVKRYLKDRMYEVYNLNGEIVYQASFVEINGSYRIAIGFENLSAVLQALILNTGDDLPDGGGVRYPVDDELSDDERIGIADVPDTYIGAYFVLFYAMKNLRNKINACENKEQLKRVTRSCSGNLLEIKQHIEDQFQINIEEQLHGQENKKASSLVYKYFLYKEYNSVVRLHNKKNLLPKLDPIKSIEDFKKLTQAQKEFIKNAYV